MLMVLAQGYLSDFIINLFSNKTKKANIYLIMRNRNEQNIGNVVFFIAVRDRAVPVERVFD